MHEPSFFAWIFVSPVPLYFATKKILLAECDILRFLIFGPLGFWLVSVCVSSGLFDAGSEF